MNAAVEVSAGVKVVRAGISSRVSSGVLLLGVVVLFLLPYLIDIGTVSTLINLFVYVILAVNWNLLAGFGGMVSVGQQAFIGLGAYGVVLLADHVGIDPFLAVPVAAVLAAVIAVPVSFLAFRLVGGYFAIGTWVIAEVVRLVNVQSQTLGAGSGISLRALAGTDSVLRIAVTYWWALGAAVVIVVGVFLLIRSRVGIALTAIRDDPTAAASNGVAVAGAKRLVYVLAAFGAGTAGGLLALSSLQVQPDSIYSVQWSAYMIFMVIIGGVGTIEGPIIGAVVFFALQQWLAQYSTVYLIVLGVVAIGVVLFAPRGLWGLISGNGRWRVFAVSYRIRPSRPSRPSDVAVPPVSTATTPVAAGDRDE